MKDEFGNRLKQYEYNYKQTLNGNFPAFIRIDGKAFHTLTKKLYLVKPFDDRLSSAFQSATIEFCKTVGSCILAYSQSDEVTFLLQGWQREDSQLWFGGSIQKLASVSASMFTRFFNLSLAKHLFASSVDAFFDARAFDVSTDELYNVFIWRQLDAVRNSISSYAQSMFSHKSLQGLKSENLLVKMREEKGFDWYSLPLYKRWGFVVHKKYVLGSINGNEYRRTVWKADLSIPSFIGDREYLKTLIEREV